MDSQGGCAQILRMNQTPHLPPAWGPQDESHFNLLSIFYYIFAGLGALGGCFMVGHWWLMPH